MGLSRMWRIMQIEEDLIYRGWGPRWTKSHEICIVLHIIRKPNLIIVLWFIQNISTFLTSLPPRRLSLKLWPIYRHRHFPLQILVKIQRAIFNVHSCISSVPQFLLEIPVFCLRIAANAIFLFNSLVNKQLASRAWKRGWSMVYCPSRLVSNEIFYRWTLFLIKYTIELLVY